MRSNPLKGNGNNITFAKDRYGNPNSAFYLRGNIAAWFISKPFDVTEFTFSLWINVLDSSKSFRILAVNGQNHIVLNVQSQKFRFSQNFGQQSSGSIFDQNVVQKNTWYALAFVVSNKDISLYKNTDLVGYANFTSNSYV